SGGAEDPDGALDRLARLGVVALAARAQGEMGERSSRPERIVEQVVEIERRRAQAPALGEVALEERQPAGGEQRLGALRRRRRGAGQLERARQRLAAAPEVAADVPEEPQRPGEPE